MRALPLTLLLGLLTSSPAFAGREVGVVVVGEATMQPQLVAQLENGLRKQGHLLVAAPMPPEAINTLIDCFVIEDEACARMVVAKRARTQSVLFARVDLQAGASGDERTVTLTAYWFDKAGGATVTVARSCERCTDITLRSTADDLIAAFEIPSKVTTGILKLDTKRPGGHVAIAGKPVGVTPLELELPAGRHAIVISQDGHEVMREVTIEAGQTRQLDIPVERPRRSKLMPTLLIGGGSAVLVAGIVLFATDQDQPPPVGPQPKFYRDTAPLGAGLVVTGALVGGFGAYLLMSSKSSSAPIAAIGSGRGYVGWAGSF